MNTRMTLPARRQQCCTQNSDARGARVNPARLQPSHKATQRDLIVFEQACPGAAPSPRPSRSSQEWRMLLTQGPGGSTWTRRRSRQVRGIAPLSHPTVFGPRRTASGCRSEPEALDRGVTTLPPIAPRRPERRRVHVHPVRRRLQLTSFRHRCFRGRPVLLRPEFDDERAEHGTCALPAT